MGNIQYPDFKLTISPPFWQYPISSFEGCRALKLLFAYVEALKTETVVHEYYSASHFNIAEQSLMFIQSGQSTRQDQKGWVDSHLQDSGPHCSLEPA